MNTPRTAFAEPISDCAGNRGQAGCLDCLAELQRIFRALRMQKHTIQVVGETAGG